MVEHLKLIQIAPDLLDRWTLNADVIGEEGHTLRRELDEVRRDPTRQVLRKAAKAARETAKQLSGEEEKAAIAIASELEEAAENGPEAS